MTKINGLPVYAATLAADTDGVLRVSLVDAPAVESNFDVFRAAAPGAKAPALYAVSDEDRHLVRGVVLRADYPIYRRDSEGDPGYYVIFSKDQIRAIAEKYIADGRANAVDTAHDGQEVDGVQLVQYFLKDAASGIAPEGFDDIADGSLFAEYHVTNEDVWAEIKAGTYKGFSVEIFYTLIPMGDTMSATLDRIFDKIQRNMSFERFKARLAALLAEPEEPAKMGSVTTDKGVIHWDGDEDLKAGDRVEVEDADGNRDTAPDGDYTTGNGKTIVVVDGAVSEIRDPEAEVADNPEDMARQRKAEKMARAEKFAQSYDEKKQRISSAIIATISGYDDEVWGYLVDAGDDFAVFDTYGEFNDWGDTYTRYRVSWNGDEPSVSDPVEVRMAFVPMDFDDSAAFKGASQAEDTTEAEEQMESALHAAETYKAENAQLRARIAELEGKPAGTPAREAFRGAAPGGADPGKTGIKGLDRLSALMDA